MQLLLPAQSLEHTTIATCDRQQVTFKLLAPEARAGVLLARGGEYVRRIRAETVSWREGLPPVAARLFGSH